jgi:hypothetical protein
MSTATIESAKMSRTKPAANLRPKEHGLCDSRDSNRDGHFYHGPDIGGLVCCNRFDSRFLGP